AVSSLQADSPERAHLPALLVQRKVHLDLDPVRAVEQQLRDAVVGERARPVRNARALETRDEIGAAGRVERDVLEVAGTALATARVCARLAAPKLVERPAGTEEMGDRLRAEEQHDERERESARALGAQPEDVG